MSEGTLGAGSVVVLPVFAGGLGPACFFQRRLAPLFFQRGLGGCGFWMRGEDLNL